MLLNYKYIELLQPHVCGLADLDIYGIALCGNIMLDDYS